MIPEWAKVGAKVVCIDTRPNAERGILPPHPYTGWSGSLNGLRLRSVYTIRSTEFIGLFGRWTVRLNEIERSFNEILGCESGYDIARFRPLISRTQQQDADMFRELLGSLDPIIRADMLLDELGEA